jgi:hypothetical protein
MSNDPESSSVGDARAHGAAETRSQSSTDLGGPTAAHPPPSAEENDVTDTERTPAVGAQAAYIMEPQNYGSDVDDWSGWVTFAGVMMILLGGFQIIEGLVALLRPAYYLVGKADLVVAVSYTGWGWVHLLLGVLVLAAGFGVMTGQTWARVVGIVLASLSALVNLAFIPAYPMWAIIVIALDVAVIFALTAYRPASAA